MWQEDLDDFLEEYENTSLKETEADKFNQVTIADKTLQNPGVLVELISSSKKSKSSSASKPVEINSDLSDFSVSEDEETLDNGGSEIDLVSDEFKPTKKNKAKGELSIDI